MSGEGDGAMDDPAPQAEPDVLARAVEAALFAASAPLSVEALASQLGSRLEVTSEGGTSIRLDYRIRG